MKKQDLLGKAEQTRQFIIEKAAPIFNVKGYAGTALSDIMQATGLTKGCIYGNFKDKEEIALAAFDYNVELIFVAAREGVNEADTSFEKLNRMLENHRRLYSRPELANGCPILNASIDADDTNPQLRQRVCAVLDRWRKAIVAVVEAGQVSGDIHKAVNADEFATSYISTIEGGNMLFSLYKETRYVDRAIDQLRRIIENELKV